MVRLVMKLHVLSKVSRAYLIETACDTSTVILLTTKLATLPPGWLFQIGITSVYYNVALCLYVLFVVKYNWTERKFKKVRIWMHGGVLLVGITMSIAVLPFVTPNWRWCYVNRPPVVESWLPGIFFFILPIGISILGMTVLMAFLVYYVRETEGKSRHRTFSGNDRPNRRSLTSRTLRQSLYFLAAFYTVWPIQFVPLVIPLVQQTYWVYILAALLGPLQGFLNAGVVLCRDRKRVLECLDTVNCFGKRWRCSVCKSSTSGESTDQPEGETHGALVQHTGNSSRSSNLEDPSEQEVQQPTILCRDSEIAESSFQDNTQTGDMRNEEGTFENEAILEYAMNAGLLDDDEEVWMMSEEFACLSERMSTTTI